VSVFKVFFLDFTNKLNVLQARTEHAPVMKGQALERRVGGLLRKYNKIFRRDRGKTQKACYVTCLYFGRNSTLVLTNTITKRQRFNQICRSVILVQV
jgi:hypothetical protein